MRGFMLMTEKGVNLQVPVLNWLTVQPTVALSFRLLSSTYTGAAVNVRRSSDNTAMDIGFVGKHLDTATLLSFVGTGNGFLAKQYNQGTLGSSGDVIQTVAASQPQIVANGVLCTFNGLPTAVFSGAQLMQTAGNVQAVGAAGYSTNNVANVTTGSAVQCVMSQDVSATVRNFSVRYLATGQYEAVWYDGSAGTVINSPYSAPENIVTSTQSSTTLSIYSNGRSAGTSAVSGSTAAASCVFTLGEDTYLPYYYTGSISEALVFSSVLSTQDRQALERNQEQFYKVSGR